MSRNEKRNAHLFRRGTLKLRTGWECVEKLRVFGWGL